MELNFPGLWRVITLVGLFLSFGGSSLLAYITTNNGQKKIEWLVHSRTNPQRYGQLYLERNEKISEEDKSANDEGSFEGLVEFVLSMFRRGEYSIPSDPEIPVERIELEDTRRMDDEVVLVFAEDMPWRVSGGKRSKTRMSIDDLEKEVERQSEISLREHEDAMVRKSWAVFASGVFLQLMGFVVEHFVVW